MASADSEQLLQRWPEDFARLVAFRKVRDLENWPAISAAHVPAGLVPLIDVVHLLSMRWADVLRLKSDGVLSAECAMDIATMLAAREPEIYDWDKSLENGDVKDVWAISSFREALDTALFVAVGQRYLDKHLRR
jgi:hypothetical protein